MVNALLTVCTGLPASLSRTVKLNVPMFVGVPLIVPLLAPRANPGGNAPAVIAQPYGVIPPLAVKVEEYAAFRAPFGTLDVPRTSGAGCTVNTVLPTTDPNVARIVLVPADTADANPAALIVATDVVTELQVTCVVKFCVVPSE